MDKGRPPTLTDSHDAKLSWAQMVTDPRTRKRALPGQSARHFRRARALARVRARGARKFADARARPRATARARAIGRRAGGGRAGGGRARAARDFNRFLFGGCRQRTDFSMRGNDLLLGVVGRIYIVDRTFLTLHLKP